MALDVQVGQPHYTGADEKQLGLDGSRNAAVGACRGHATSYSQCAMAASSSPYSVEQCFIAVNVHTIFGHLSTQMWLARAARQRMARSLRSLAGSQELVPLDDLALRIGGGEWLHRLGGAGTF